MGRLFTFKIFGFQKMPKMMGLKMQGSLPPAGYSVLPLGNFHR